MAGTDKIQVFRSEDVDLNFTMSETPVPDITGWTILFTVEGAVTSPKLITQAGTITDGPNGKFRVTLTDTQTDIAAGHYQYDAWRTDSGTERALAVGTFEILDSARIPV